MKKNEAQLKNEVYFKEKKFEHIELVYKAVMSSLNLKENTQGGHAAETSDASQGENNNENKNNNDVFIEDDHSDDDDDITDNSAEFKTPNKTPGTVIFKKRNTSDENVDLIKLFEDMSDNLDRILSTIEMTAAEGHYSLAKLSIEDFERDWLDFKAAYNRISIADMNYNVKTKCFEEFDRVKVRYFMLIQEVKALNNENISDSGRSQTQNTSYGAPTAAPFKLEAIKIPNFLGNYEAWSTFSNLFKTLVIENKSINGVQRMQYLKSVLGGDAEKAIAGLDITDTNFDRAWEILIERLDNKQGIRENQVKGMLNLETVSCSNPRRVRNLHDKAKEYVALLQGITLDEFIIILIKSKLVANLQTKYEEQRSEKDTLKGFFAFLNQRCRILECYEPNHFKKDFKDKKQGNPVAVNHICPCCNDNHLIFFCNKFRSLKVNERKDSVKQKSLCLLCLRANHTVSTCTFKKMCPSCGKKHNGLLHFGDQTDGKKAR